MRPRVSREHGLKADAPLGRDVSEFELAEEMEFLDADELDEIDAEKFYDE